MLLKQLKGFLLMEHKLILLLKKYPRIYNLIEDVYFTIRWQRIKELFLGTKVKENEWATRHLREGNKWITNTFKGINQPHRKILIEKIEKSKPFTNILEIGSGCSPNLYLLAKKNPNINFCGVDINPLVIKKGNELFKKNKLNNVNLYLGKADKLSHFLDNSCDVVFTDAVLIYIGPDKIKKIINEMIRITKKKIILVEWNVFTNKQTNKQTNRFIRYKL